MNFCPNCGEKNEVNNAKFCSECGFSLIVEKEVLDAPVTEENIDDIEQENSLSIVVDDENSEYNAQNAYALGVKFEDTVEQILIAKRYSTQRRCRLEGQKGKSEIDILAVKKYNGQEKIIAVECKNYTNPVPVKDIRDFISKLQDLRIKNGLFVAYSNFSSEARSWGENASLELWDGDIVSEKFYELNVGRLNVGDKVDFKYYLPIKIDYSDVVKLDLDNKSKVEISNTKLIWRPFYKIYYELNSIKTDPINRKHRISDSGFFIVDALIKSQNNSEGRVKKVVKTMSLGILGKSSDEKREDKEVGIYKKELRQHPERDLSLIQPDNYKVIKFSPQISETAARGETIDHVVMKNTKTIEYELPQKRRKRDDFNFDLPQIRIHTLKPSRKDVTINDIQLIYTPKWEVEFESVDYSYTKIISANSGNIITDNITNCSQHMGLLKKKNVAVCEVCGQALCKDHIFKCPTCNSWLCEEHSIQCSGCKTRFCLDHIKNKCIECEGNICENCVLKCPICGEIHCNKHMTKCDKCKNVVCTSCTKKEGSLIFKKTICDDCHKVL